MQSHFGADPADLLNGGAARVRALRGAELAGIHIYSGGQIQSADKLAGTFEHAINLAEQIVQAGIPLRLLDLGGGFPWPFGTSDPPMDISALREKLQSVNTQRRLTADAQLWFESGRYLVASCGTLLSTVLDVKIALGGKTHVILDTGMVHLGGMAGLGRIYRAVASIEPLAGPDGELLQSVDVVGPTDYALDYVARDTSVPPLKAGDVVAIPNVGAYGLTASLVAFTGLQPPAEVCCRGDSVVAAYRLRTGHERISKVRANDKYMDDITTQFEECLRRHLRWRNPTAINYDMELSQLGLDSMTAVAVLLDMEKTFNIRFPDDMLVEGTFRTAGKLKEAVQMLRERQAS